MSKLQGAGIVRIKYLSYSLINKSLWHVANQSELDWDKQIGSDHLNNPYMRF